MKTKFQLSLEELAKHNKGLDVALLRQLASATSQLPRVDSCGFSLARPLEERTDLRPARLISMNRMG